MLPHVPVARFQHPDRASADEPDRLWTRRVVALPGETVEVRDGRVVVDGAAIEEPYADGPIEGEVAPMVLGSDQYFVMADRRAAGKDSREHGALPRDSIVARVAVRYWPPNRFGRP